jgi:hypothetical protein
MAVLPNEIRYGFVSASVLGLLLSGTGAHAEGSDMDWLGVVYIWGSGITIDAREQSAGVDFEDLIDDLEMAGMVHVETQGDSFGGFVDVVFVGVGDNESRPNLDINTDNDTTVMDLAVVWSPGAERMTGFELYGGLRYVDNDFHIVADPVPPALPTLEGGSDKSYTDFLFGARYIAPISENWRLEFNGDISGGDTEGTFSVAAYASYRMGQHNFYAGYKHFEMDLESGGGGDLTVTLTGPVLAYGYSF